MANATTKRVRLGEVATFAKGAQINGEDLSPSFPYPFLNGGVNPSGNWKEANCPADTITISEGGNSCGHVNFMETPFWCGSHCYYLANVKGHAKYVYYALKSQQVRLMAQRTGACMPNIKKKDLGAFDFAYCENGLEQKRIAEVLDKISAMKRNAEARVQKLDLLIKSRFVEMFGDPVTNPKGWPMSQLDEHVDFLTSGSRGWAKYYADKGEYFITIKNVKNTRVTVDDVQHIVPPQGAETERTRVKENDLLISITADLGRTGIVSAEIANHGAYINQHLTCIRLKPDSVLPLFVAFFMESAAGKAQFDRKNQSAVKAGLNFNAIRSLEFYLPPLALQREFATFVEKVEALKATAQRECEQVDLLYRAQLQEYFE